MKKNQNINIQLVEIFLEKDKGGKEKNEFITEIKKEFGKYTRNSKEKVSNSYLNGKKELS